MIRIRCGKLYIVIDLKTHKESFGNFRVRGGCRVPRALGLPRAWVRVFRDLGFARCKITGLGLRI